MIRAVLSHRGTVAVAVHGLAFASTFGLAWIIATTFGAGATLDVYFLAVAVPVLATGVVRVSFGNSFAALLAGELRERERGWLLWRGLAGASLVGVALGGLVAALLPMGLALWLRSAPHLTGRLDVRLGQALALLVPLGALTGVAGAWHYASQRPSRPALGIVAGNGAAAMLIAAAGARGGVTTLVAAALANALVNALVVTSSLRWAVRIRRGDAHLEARVGRALWGTLPLGIGSLATQTNLVMDRTFIAPFGAGAISALEFATGLTRIPIALTCGPFIPLLIAHWARLTASKPPEALLHSLGRLLSVATWVSVPVAVVVALAPKELVALAFGYGRFTQEDVVLTAGLLRALALSVIGVVAWGVPRLSRARAWPSSTANGYRPRQHGPQCRPRLEPARAARACRDRMVHDRNPDRPSRAAAACSEPIDQPRCPGASLCAPRESRSGGRRRDGRLRRQRCASSLRCRRLGPGRLRPRLGSAVPGRSSSDGRYDKSRSRFWARRGLSWDVNDGLVGTEVNLTALGNNAFLAPRQGRPSIWDPRSLIWESPL